MKLALFAVAGIAAATLVNALPSPDTAESAGAPAIEQSRASDELSARKRRVPEGITYVDAVTGETVNPHRPRHIVPSHDFIGGPDGYPGEYAMRRAAGQCVMDFGYGRWKAC